MMMKTLTAGVLAATLALTSLTPTTARAGMSEEDAIAGLLTLLFIGAAIHHSRNNDPAPVPVPPVETQSWRDLPEQCQRRMTRRNGNRINFFAQRCLINNYEHMDRLPERCHVRFRTEGGQRRQGYRTRCLSNEGFRTNRH